MLLLYLSQSGWTALTLAVRLRLWQILKLLLNSLSETILNDVLSDKVVDKDGWNLLHHAVSVPIPEGSSANATLTLYTILHFNSNDSKFNENRLRWINSVADFSMTPLHIAAKTGLYFHVELLVNLGADINALCEHKIDKEKLRVKPLYLAAIYNRSQSAEIVEFLLDQHSKMVFDKALEVCIFYLFL